MAIEIDALFAWAKDRYDQIEESAQEISDDFVSFIDEGNNKRKVMEQSVLRIRVRRRGDYTLSIVWTYTRFFRSRDGKWIPRTIEIPKGRTTVTPIDRIMRHSRGWEMDKVRECERKLAELRGCQATVRRLVANLRQCKAAFGAIEESKSEVDTNA